MQSLRRRKNSQEGSQSNHVHLPGVQPAFGVYPESTPPDASPQQVQAILAQCQQQLQQLQEQQHRLQAELEEEESDEEEDTEERPVTTDPSRGTLPTTPIPSPASPPAPLPAAADAGARPPAEPEPEHNAAAAEAEAASRAFRKQVEKIFKLCFFLYFMSQGGGFERLVKWLGGFPVVVIIVVLLHILHHYTKNIRIELRPSNGGAGAVATNPDEPRSVLATTRLVAVTFVKSIWPSWKIDTILR